MKDLLSNLGRRTLRGVKPCPKCGTYNGTRGFSCKNKSCDVVFKAADDRKKKSTEACRISTENQDSQVFSVRLRDKGPDYRDFVKITTNLIDGGDGNLSTTQSAQCFVEMCPKNNAFNLLPITTCQHIQASLSCHTESEVLPIKASLIHSLNIPVDLKDELWNMVTDSAQDHQELQYPIVQRVSKTIFVVKCAAIEKFPLGFLHCSVVETRNKAGNVERKFLCPCRKIKQNHSAEGANKESMCVHFYACILAFISDEKFMNEFSYHIQASNVLSVSLDSLDELTERQLVVHFEVLPQVSDENDLLCGDVRVLESLVLPSDDGSAHFNDDPSTNVNLSLPVSINMSELLNSSLETQVTCGNAVGGGTDGSIQIKRGKVKIPALKRQLPAKVCASAALAAAEVTSSLLLHCNGVGGGGSSFKKVLPSDENLTLLCFENWLASVTERINQTMHFQMVGSPDPLVYQIPHSFFECLRERISSGARKKRLPNTTTVFQRKDAPPFSALTKYTWHLNNPVHVKHIFDTPLVSLELTRSFVENQDGTFDVYVPRNLETMTSSVTNHGAGLPTLKPLELRTYLKIGHVEGDSSIPFTIEWVPEILSLSKFGQLSLQFQFGHQRHPITRMDQSSTRHDALKKTRKKMKVSSTDTEVKDLQNLKLDYSEAPLNDSEFHELTKSVP